MRFRTPGQHRTLDAFREHLRGIDPEFDVEREPEACRARLARPFVLGGRTLRNRFAVQPMEGWDGTPDGLPTERTLRRWRNFGRSGAALVWGGEAFAVRPDGRANPNQLCAGLAPDVEGGLRALLAAVREGAAESGGAPPFVGLQLTHSGRWSRPHGQPVPRIASRHAWLDARAGVTSDAPVLSDAELEEIASAYVAAARLAARVGFDFVDVKACHGYLLHELLAARERSGRYGGAFENRVRLLLEIAREIRGACPDLVVAVRLSAADVQPHARNLASGIGEPIAEPVPPGFGARAAEPREFDLAEPFRLLGALRSEGVPLINVTLGSPYWCAHLQRPATYPPSDGYLPPVDPLASVLCHLRTVRACKARFPDLAFVGSGYSYLQEWLPHVAAHEVGAGHVDFVGLGRMMLSYAELPRDVLAGRPLERRRICRTFSDCTTAPRNGLPSGCYPLDPEYRESPEAVTLKEIKQGWSR